jgi:hypothetical protein
MSCTCGHGKHQETCNVYTAGGGWCTCTSYAASGDPAAWLKIPGRATYRKLYADTQAWRDRVVADAAAKKRKVGKW